MPEKKSPTNFDTEENVPDIASIAFERPLIPSAAEFAFCAHAMTPMALSASVPDFHISFLRVSVAVLSVAVIASVLRFFAVLSHFSERSLAAFTHFCHNSCAESSHFFANSDVFSVDSTTNVLNFSFPGRMVSSLDKIFPFCGRSERSSSSS